MMCYLHVTCFHMYIVFYIQSDNLFLTCNEFAVVVCER